MDFCPKNKNKNDEIIRYKAWLVAFTKPGIDIWRDIFTSIGCNNISIFDYPSCKRRYAFTWMMLQPICTVLLRMIFIWKFLNDLICLTRKIIRRIIQ